MAFGQNPATSTQTSLPANQFPIATVAVPNTANGDLTAMEGGPASSDSNGNKTAPASMYVKDGGNVGQGLTTDAAVTGDNPGTLSAKMRGWLKIFTDIWDSVNHRIRVDGSGVTQPVSLVSPAVTGDSQAQANFAELVVGLYNSTGNVIDRLRDAGSIGDGYTIGFLAAGQMLFNGGSWDRLRTPGKFITIQNIAVTAGSPVTMWTPGSGRKFHLQGFALSLSVAGYIVLYDNATEIIRTPANPAGTGFVNPANFGNGYSSVSSNNPLKMDVSASGSINGFLFGTEEF